MKEFTDFDLARYEACTVTGHTGGATWLRDPEGQYYVIAILTPVEILTRLRAGDTVRAEVYKK